MEFQCCCPWVVLRAHRPALSRAYPLGWPSPPRAVQSVTQTPNHVYPLALAWGLPGPHPAGEAARSSGLDPSLRARAVSLGALGPRPPQARPPRAPRPLPQALGPTEAAVEEEPELHKGALFWPRSPPAQVPALQCQAGRARRPEEALYDPEPRGAVPGGWRQSGCSWMTGVLGGARTCPRAHTTCTLRAQERGYSRCTCTRALTQLQQTRTGLHATCTHLCPCTPAKGPFSGGAPCTLIPAGPGLALGRVHTGALSLGRKAPHQGICKAIIPPWAAPALPLLGAGTMRSAPSRGQGFGHPLGVGLGRPLCTLWLAAQNARRP